MYSVQVLCLDNKSIVTNQRRGMVLPKFHFWVWHQAGTKSEKTSEEHVVPVNLQLAVSKPWTSSRGIAY